MKDTTCGGASAAFFKRRTSRPVKAGRITIGGNAPVSVQSMTTFLASDVENTVRQINALYDAGAEIVRFAVTNEKDARAIPEIKRQTKAALVADVQFDWKLAVLSAECGVDKVRVNPGNIGAEENIRRVAEAVKHYGIPVRVGGNTGSIDKEYLQKYGVSAQALGESVLRDVSRFEKYGVNDIVISVKASSAPLTVAAYRYVAGKCDYPLHLGVTEAGTEYRGVVKSSVGIGSLLLDGIGDTIRVSLSGDPVREVVAANAILESVGLKTDFAEVVACPTCGRCMWDAVSMAKRVEELVADVRVPLKIAVMGCVVNGIGESQEADLGIAGAKGGAALFSKGKVIKTVKQEDIEREFLALVKAEVEKRK